MPIGIVIAAVKGVLSLKAATDTLKTVTPLVSEARKWYEAREKSRPTALADSSTDAQIAQLKERLEQIEADGDRHAEAISALAAQTEALSEGLQIIARRVTAMLIVSATVALAALVVAAVVIF